MNLELEVMAINMLTVCLFRELITIRCLVRVIFGVYVVGCFLIHSIRVGVLSVPSSLSGTVVNCLYNLLMPLIFEPLLSLDVILYMLVCIRAHTILNQNMFRHP